MLYDSNLAWRPKVVIFFLLIRLVYSLFGNSQEKLDIVWLPTTPFLASSLGWPKKWPHISHSWKQFIGRRKLAKKERLKPHGVVRDEAQEGPLRNPACLPWNMSSHWRTAAIIDRFVRAGKRFRKSTKAGMMQFILGPEWKESMPESIRVETQMFTKVTLAVAMMSQNTAHCFKKGLQRKQIHELVLMWHRS